MRYDFATAKWNNLSLDKSSVGLGQVDNTADVDKPVSNAAQAALDSKAASADVYTRAEADIAFAATDAVLRWDGVTGLQPLRSTVTTDANRRVRWVQPTAPPSTAGYALSGDVWERSV